MTDRKRTTCPFCRHGCELEVGQVGQSGQTWQFRMEYPGDAKVNAGRLCPRGNSASILVDHPRRLAYPLLDGREVTWDAALSRLETWFGSVRPEETAVVYSRGLTRDELGLVCGLASALGTPHLVCGYLEPGNWFGLRLDGVTPAGLDDVSGAKVTLLSGDVFATSPVAARRIVEARYADRANRLIVIDSVQTRQSGFAHLWIRVHPGTEPFALAGIAALLDSSLRQQVDPAAMAAVCGTEMKLFERAADILKGNGPAFVGSAMSFGRVVLPWLHSLAAQLVAVKAKAAFAGFSEGLVPQSAMQFGQFRDALASGNLKLVLWFGGLHPYSYPEVLPELAQVQFRCATSIFRPAGNLPGLVLPVPSELEKDGAGESMWGAVQRTAVVKAVSGTRSVAGLIGGLREVKGQALSEWPVVAAKEAVAELAAAAKTFRPPEGCTLLGEKHAFGIGGFFDEENVLSMSPNDARRLGVNSADRVVARTEAGQCELGVRITRSLADGQFVVGVNRHQNRALFPLWYEAGTGRTSVPPVKVEVWRKG
uniref:4Fe-4S Mo/W bis-MGD-type domain-containing protein n=1 Tax=candidate division WOR-3 bacterium TaxID=2052148 RepID=A0A7C4G8U5_UNCW3